MNPQVGAVVEKKRVKPEKERRWQGQQRCREAESDVVREGEAMAATAAVLSRGQWPAWRS
jgi:hypothetical protein